MMLLVGWMDGWTGEGGEGGEREREIERDLIDGDGGRVCFHFIVLRRRRASAAVAAVAIPARDAPASSGAAMAPTYFSPTTKNPSRILSE